MRLYEFHECVVVVLYLLEVALLAVKTHSLQNFLLAPFFQLKALLWILLNKMLRLEIKFKCFWRDESPVYLIRELTVLRHRVQVDRHHPQLLPLRYLLDYPRLLGFRACRESEGLSSLMDVISYTLDHFQKLNGVYHKCCLLFLFALRSSLLSFCLGYRV